MLAGPEYLAQLFSERLWLRRHLIFRRNDPGADIADDQAGGSSTLSNFSWQGGKIWQGRVALAEAVAGAQLIPLEGGGHELHRADWDTIIGAIVKHTRREGE